MNDPALEKEVNYAINNINERRIYNTQGTSSSHDDDSNARNGMIISKSHSQVMNWLTEYSEVKFERQDSSAVKGAKLSGIKRNS